jgi:hypothetical protein
VAHLRKPRIFPTLGWFLPRPSCENLEFSPHLGGFAHGPASKTLNSLHLGGFSHGPALETLNSPHLGGYARGPSSETPNSLHLGGFSHGPASETPNSPALGWLLPWPSFGNPEIPLHLGGFSHSPALETLNSPHLGGFSRGPASKTPNSLYLGGFSHGPTLKTPNSPHLGGFFHGPALKTLAHLGWFLPWSRVKNPEIPTHAQNLSYAKREVSRFKDGMSVGSESRRRRAESQWIVAARPLCHLQYPVAYLSRLQRILLNDRLKLNFKAAPTEMLPDRGSQVTRAPGGAEATPLLRVKIQSRSDKRRF